MNPCAILVRVLLAFAVALSWLHPSQVSGDVCLKVWPTSLEVCVAEGEAAGCVVNVQNEGDEPIDLRVYALDYSIGTYGDYHFSEPALQSYSCATWLDIDAPVLHLKPGESRAATVSVRVPERVEPGEHHAALFFEQVTESGEGTGVSVAGRVASLLYVTVPGASDAQIVASADILQLILPGWTDGRPVKICALVRNAGNVHLTIAAKAYFTDFRGNQAGETDLGQAVVLPGDDRIMEATWENPPLFGRIKARVVIGYLDDQGALVNKEANANFQVIPWKLIMAVGLPFIIIGLAALVLSRRFRLRLSMERRANSSSDRLKE